MKGKEESNQGERRKKLRQEKRGIKATELKKLLDTKPELSQEKRKIEVREESNQAKREEKLRRYKIWIAARKIGIKARE